MQTFQDLEVWRRAFRLIGPVYRLTARYPKEEKFGLTTQTRKCVIAVPANIAEGTRRRTKGEFRNSLSVASGENSEECLLLAGVELRFASADEVRPLIAELHAIDRMLRALDITLSPRYATSHESARPQHSKPERPKPPDRPSRY